jgi:hypothetical protein
VHHFIGAYGYFATFILMVAEIGGRPQLAPRHGLVQDAGYVVGGLAVVPVIVALVLVVRARQQAPARGASPGAAWHYRRPQRS